METEKTEQSRGGGRRVWVRVAAGTAVGCLIVCAFAGHSNWNVPRAAGSSIYGTSGSSEQARLDLAIPVVPGGGIRWTPAKASPTKRFEGYACGFGDKLFTFGGYNSLIHPYAVNADGAVYDAASDTWTSLGTVPMPPSHAGMARDIEHGMLYFVGGLQGAYPGVTTGEVWSYDMNRNAWAQLPGLPLPLAAGCAVIVGGQLHYFGGIGSHDRDTNLPVHYVLTLGDEHWKKAADFPTPRDHMTALALDRKIYVFGGEIGHDKYHLQQTLAHVYDPAKDAWTRLADMPRSKSHTESSAFVHDGKIVIAGGQVEAFASTDTVLQYDPAADSWGMLGRLPQALQGAMLQSVGDRLVLTNGYDGTHMKTETWVGRFENEASAGK